MALAQGLDIKESEDLVRLEQFEGRNVPCNRLAYPVWTRSVMIPLMILQKMQAAILPGVCVRNLRLSFGKGRRWWCGDKILQISPQYPRSFLILVGNCVGLDVEEQPWAL